MNRTLTTHILAVQILCTALIPLSSFAADFNPHLIISDNDLTSYQAMTVKDVQDFLDIQKSAIGSMRFTDADGSTRTAAEIIVSAANEERISPRYILVVLQKEQSLISSRNPSQKQLDWATGYGICDSCSMDDPSVQKFRGFATQVRRSAGIMRYYYDNVQFNWIKRAGQQYSIDNLAVTPQSNATAFLYTYTPHLSGNKNFWKIWSQWFTNFYPDGSVIKVADDKTIYLIENGKRRPFMNKASFISRYSESSVLPVEPSDLAIFPIGTPISIPNYSIVRSPSGMLFMLIDTVKHPIASTAVFKTIGYNPGEVEDISEEELAAYDSGTFITTASLYPLGAVIQEKKSKQLYYVKNGVRYVIPSPDVAQINFPNKKIITLDLKQISKFEFDPTKVVSFRDGTLLSMKGSRDIYVVSNGKLRLIPSETVFNNLGYKKKNVIQTSEQSLTNFPLGEPVTDIVGKTQVAAR
jgi:hypothetical protein